MEMLALITILCIFAFLFALICIDNKVSKMEKKHKEDMELIKGMLQELSKKPFEHPFDTKTFSESKPSGTFKPFDRWGQVCAYACPPTPYDPNITTSATNTLNEEG